MWQSVMVVLSLFLASFSSVTMVRAETWQDYLRDTHQLLYDKRQEEARKPLYLARDLAWQEGSWSGSVAAGMGFATLRDKSEARRSYAVARDIASKQEKWEGVLSAGRGFAAIRDEEEARRSYDIGRAIASKQGSWEGLLQAGRGFEGLRDFKEARDSYEGARKLALQKGKEDFRRFERSVRFPTATLVRRLDLLEVAPGLARSWEIRDDGTIDFHLERGVQCFDDRFVDAKAVFTTFEENRQTWMERLDIISVEMVEADWVRIRTKMMPATRVLPSFSLLDTSIQCPP